MAGYEAQDPIVFFKKRILDGDLVSEAALADIDTRAQEMIEEAVRFAEESPSPAPEECLNDVYVSYPVEEVAS
jgi:pyruvate dehydrogenase E1 component alpha subunit